MRSRWETLPLLSICASGTFADFLGPTYPQPLDLSSSDSFVAAGWKNLTTLLDSYFKQNQTSDLTKPLAATEAEKITFSAGLFSLHDADATKFQYHYTSPEISNSTLGTKKVDGDSIYRVASVSKLITVFAGLLELKPEEWDLPLTQVIPGLAGDGSDPLLKIRWDKVTSWALATQIAGVPTLGIAQGDFLASFAAAGPNAAAAYGLPTLNPDILGPCWNKSGEACAPDGFIQGISGQPPNFLPWTTPAYADAGFMLLGLAIANITGKPMSEIYEDAIFNPLGMASSYSTHPTDEAEVARSVVAGPPATGFTLEGGVTVPSGGLLSTIHDLDKLGLAILNSTLYPADLTRKWMKPSSHTASLSYSVGAPWEIIRYANPTTGKITDIYTKLGDSGNYGGALVLIPDYDAGFSFLNAYSDAGIRSKASLSVLDYVVEALLPALEAQAAAEAARNFVGTYSLSDGELNSSITITFNESTIPSPSTPLSISHWTSNGKDILKKQFNGDKPHLLLSIPKQSCSGPGQVAFQVATGPQTTSYVAAQKQGLGPYSAVYYSNFDWLTVDQSHYGNIGINLFIFDVDEGGKATALSPAAFRATLQRRS